MARKSKYYKRKDGIYETIKTINGKRVAFRGKTCAEVDRKILEYNADAIKGRPFPVVVDEWLKGRENVIAPSTYRGYAIAAERWKRLFPVRCGEIKPLDIQRRLTEFEGKGYSASTVTIELNVLRQIFSHAVIAGDVDISPVDNIRKSRGLPRKRRNALTEEQERLVEEYRGEDWLFGLMLLYTGCRRGELLALNWQDIDRERGTITVNKKINYCYGNKPTLEHFLKNRNADNNDGNERIVPLLAPLAAVLPRNRIGRIFAAENGEFMKHAELNKRWKNYCRNVGLIEIEIDKDGNEIETFPITPHCFRHSFTTICYESGIDAKSAAAFIGDTEQVTRNVYTELRNRHKFSSVDRLNAYLEMRAAEREEKAK